VGTFGYAVGQSSDVAAKRPLVEFIETVTDDEDDYFRRSFEALEGPASRLRNPEPTDTTGAFVDLPVRAALEGSYAETLAVLVPAEWIYETWTSVAETHGDPDTAPPSAGADLPTPYAEWIDLQAVPPFVEFVAWLRGHLDAGHGTRDRPGRRRGRPREARP
jgi:thiaminase/transcriptional activator TenA